MEFRRKEEGHMEIINLHSCLLKMPALRRINVQSSERQSGKIVVSSAYVYHYSSYSRHPLPPEPNSDTPGFFLATLFFKVTEEILFFF